MASGLTDKKKKRALLLYQAGPWVRENITNQKVTFTGSTINIIDENTLETLGDINLKNLT